MSASSWKCPECGAMLAPHCTPRITRMSCRWLYCDLCWTLVHTEWNVILTFPKSSPTD